jgi:hypothetical protein
MLITPKTLSIAPYVSTSWANISTLHAKEDSGVFELLLILKDGHRIVVPNLDRKAIDLIFMAHAKYTHGPAVEKAFLGEVPLNFTPPTREGGVAEAFTAAQHNPDQANLPPLPPAFLKKISALALSLGTEALQSMPKAVADCRCIYCQLMNSIFGEIEEEVTEEDLKFRDWEIEERADKLYLVKNPIEPNEHYSVFLGQPIGCTCGCKNCEHIRAVLST